MAEDFEVTGQEQFIRLAKNLNAQGKAGRGLWRELNGAIKEAVEPMVEVVRRRLTEYLPDRYANEIRTKITVRVSRSTKGAGPALKLIGTSKGRSKRRRVGMIDKGTLRHPVYRMDTWVDQGVRPGFWSTPLTESADIPRKLIRRAIQDTLRKVTN
jgi:hypothetical protein